MLQRPTSFAEETNFTEQLNSIKQVNLDGKIYPVDFIAGGGSGSTISFPYLGRQSILKIYSRDDGRLNYRFARERRVHNELQRRGGIKYNPSFNDRSLITVDRLEDCVLYLKHIPYEEEYVGKEVVCSIQDIATGQLMNDWNPESAEEYTTVFRSYAEGIDHFRKIGIADPDRNRFNATVSDINSPDVLDGLRSPAVHFDFGTASMVDFNIYTFLNLLRNKECFASSKDRLNFLAFVFNFFVYLNDTNFSANGFLQVRDLKVTFQLLAHSLIKTSQRGMSIRSIKKLTRNLSDEEIAKRLTMFESIFNEALPAEMDSNIMIVFAGIDFNNILSDVFGEQETVLNWDEVLTGIAKNTVSTFDLPEDHVLGHPSSPCPMMLLDKIDYQDINAVAVCSIYQMAWTMFTKLTGGVIPVPMIGLQVEDNAATTEEDYWGMINTYWDKMKIPSIYIAQLSFQRYLDSGYIPFISEKDFLDAVAKAPGSIMSKNLAVAQSVYYYFQNLFDSIHEVELKSQDKGKRINYLNAVEIVNDIGRILQDPKTVEV